MEWLTQTLPDNDTMALITVALFAFALISGVDHLLWIACAALLVNLLTISVSLHMLWLWFVLASTTLVGVIICYRWRLLRRAEAPPPIELEQPGRQLIGCHTRLESPLINGSGRLKVGNTIWPVVSSEDLPSGSEVVVVEIEGITLRVVGK